MIPPAVQTVIIIYADVCGQITSLATAKEKDTNWLNSLGQEDATKWNGFNKEVSRTEGVLNPANMCLFGPLIDATPLHLDTVLTILTYMH